MLEAERGKYKVSIAHGEVFIDARKERNPLYFHEPVSIPSIEDLKDLFIAIGSALDQYYATRTEQ